MNSKNASTSDLAVMEDAVLLPAEIREALEEMPLHLRVKALKAAYVDARDAMLAAHRAQMLQDATEEETEELKKVLQDAGTGGPVFSAVHVGDDGWRCETRVGTVCAKIFCTFEPPEVHVDLDDFWQWETERPCYELPGRSRRILALRGGEDFEHSVTTNGYEFNKENEGRSFVDYVYGDAVYHVYFRE